MATLLWLTQDLRFDDNPAFNAAAGYEAPILPLYWHDENNPALHTGAAEWWLNRSLVSFHRELVAQGGALSYLHGDFNAFTQLVESHSCFRIIFSASCEPYLRNLQRRLYEWAKSKGIECQRFGGLSITQPENILTKNETYYRVFTPYYRTCLEHINSPTVEAINAKKLKWLKPKGFSLPTVKDPHWAVDFEHYWQPGEKGALERLDDVIEDLHLYADRRDVPSEDMTSKLSPHLHFGEISPRRLWQKVSSFWPEGEASPFLRQLIWRDFSRYLLQHFPAMESSPFNPKFEGFEWEDNPEYLDLWCRGQTGYPIVDAGMRQLWQTGWMHNRVRMVVASFLTKHLRVHWREGARWFWDTLVDADLANNTAGWQWVAGCGADAAPYFRIFNPITQGQKFDSNGHYIREYVPELSELPDKWIHCPWRASEEVLKQAGVTLGVHYPHPIVEHADARERALVAYDKVKSH